MSRSDSSWPKLRRGCAYWDHSGDGRFAFKLSKFWKRWASKYRRRKDKKEQEEK